MAQPYIGEIRMFAGNFAPQGWFFCDGQVLQIAANETLFQLIGTTYGGDGNTTFALPDLRGRVPIHMGNSYVLAANGGTETVTLTVQQIPPHTHVVMGSQRPATQAQPGNAVLAQGTTTDPYVVGGGSVPLSPSAITPAGGNQPHNNMQPFLCINFIISNAGIFPSAT